MLRLSYYYPCCFTQIISSLEKKKYQKGSCPSGQFRLVVALLGLVVCVPWFFFRYQVNSFSAFFFFFVPKQTSYAQGSIVGIQRWSHSASFQLQIHRAYRLVWRALGIVTDGKNIFHSLVLTNSIPYQPLRYSVFICWMHMLDIMVNILRGWSQSSQQLYNIVTIIFILIKQMTELRLTEVL